MTLIEQVKEKYKNNNNIYFTEEPGGNFEDLYIKVRNAEGRIYSDEELKMLPDSNRYHSEWIIRKHSTDKLIKYISKNQSPKKILEAGCGNGWLSAKLSEISLSEVAGLDINLTELKQAERVFSGKKNLVFIYGNIFKLDMKFDYIILAGVTSYFKDIISYTENLLLKLNHGGEIHLIENPFYSDIKSAKRRSVDYYQKLGFPEMTEYYHHHSLDELRQFGFRVIYNPASLISRVRRRLNGSLSPFHWLLIKSR